MKNAHAIALENVYNKNLTLRKPHIMDTNLWKNEGKIINPSNV